MTKYFACVSLSNRFNSYGIKSTKILLHIFLFLLTELGSQVTLKELFREYKRGDIPPIRTFKYKPNPQLLQLRRKDADRVDEFPISSILVARAHVIIGWKKQDNIRPIFDVSGKTNQVFDIDKDRFVSLSSNELWKLGVDRRFSLSCKDDIAAAKRKSIPKAIHQENHKINNQSNNQEIRPVQYQSIHQANPQEIHLPNNQAIQQENLYAINQAHYQGNIRANPQTILQSYHEEWSQASPQEIHPAHHRGSHEENAQEYSAHNVAIRQAYYEMYEKVLKGHKP